jgi:6-pyruvoyltetrahydropterin/6-carboxytetrahydropterin synthase
MYEISVRHEFDAAHCLRGYKGKCETLHGHRFQVVANLRANETNDIGLAYDFTQLRGHLKEIMDTLDHKNLNEIEPFDRINPSSENIAAAVYTELEERLGPSAGLLYSIQVWESPECCVTYRPGEG